MNHSFSDDHLDKKHYFVKKRMRRSILSKKVFPSFEMKFTNQISVFGCLYFYENLEVFNFERCRLLIGQFSFQSQFWLAAEKLINWSMAGSIRAVAMGPHTHNLRNKKKSGAQFILYKLIFFVHDIGFQKGRNETLLFFLGRRYLLSVLPPTKQI